VWSTQRLVFVSGAAVALLVAAIVVVSILAHDRASHRVEAPVLSGWTSLPCAGADDAELVRLALADGTALIMVGNGVRESLDSLTQECAADTIAEYESLPRPRCTGPTPGVPTVELAGLTVHQFTTLTGTDVIACRVDSNGALERLVIVIDRRPNGSQLRPEVVAAAAPIRFADS
jgi:hypothetical protein